MKTRLFLCVLSLLLFLSVAPGCTSQEEVLHIHVLSVGQGDCVLLSQGEEHILVDTGSATSRDQLLGELKRLGVDELAAILVTHPHEDHYGNARVALETYTVKTLFLPEAPGDELGYRVLQDTATKQNIGISHLRDGDSFALGAASFEVLCPIPQDPEPNNTGLVLRIRFGTQTMLLMGDAEQPVETALLARGADLDCDFLKVGHHGSKTASAAQFLQAATPQIAAISCGADNDYGFPHREVLDGLAAIGATVYRTDTMGSLHFVCDGESVRYME